MASTLTELVNRQREFDLAHASRGRSWAGDPGRESLSALFESTVGIAGEIGEFANLVKKIGRGDFPINTVRQELASELADVFIYVLKLSDQLGIDLEAAFNDKVDLNTSRFARFSRPQIDT